MLYLHIGYNKTATTTIQSFLSANRDRLLELGYDYPMVGRFHGDGIAHHNLVMAGIRPRHFRPEWGMWTDLRRHLETEAAANTVVSSEWLAYMSEAEVSEVAEILRHTSTRIVVYLRAQAALIQSLYQQRIKNARIAMSFDEYFDRSVEEEQYRYYDYLQRWHVFGDDAVSVRVLEREQLQDGDPVADFLGTIGLNGRPDELSLRRTSDRNPAPGPLTLELIRRTTEILVAEGMPNEHVRRHVSRPIRLLAKRLGWDDIPTNLLSHEQLAACVERFAEQNEKLAGRYLRRSGSAFLETPQVRARAPGEARISLEHATEVISEMLLANLAGGAGPGERASRRAKAPRRKPVGGRKRSGSQA